MEQSVRIGPSGGIRIVDAIRNPVGRIALGSESWVPGKIPIPFVGQRDGNKRWPSLMKKGYVVRHEKEGTILAVVNMRDVNGPSQSSAEVVPVNPRLEEWVAVRVPPSKRVRGAECGITVEPV